MVGLGESVTAALHAYTGEIVWWSYNRSMNRAPVCLANGVFSQSFYDGSLEAFDAHTGRPLYERLFYCRTILLDPSFPTPYNPG